MKSHPMFLICFIACSMISFAHSLWADQIIIIDNEPPVINGLPTASFINVTTNVPHIQPFTVSDELPTYLSVIGINLPPGASIVRISAGSGVANYELRWTPLESHFRLYSGIQIKAIDTNGAYDLENHPMISRGGIHDLSSQALIVYNSNSELSGRVAEYYRSARSINPNRLCGVPMPVGLYAKAEQVRVAQKKILENCVCPLIPVATRPNPCSTETAEMIATYSPVTHLIYAKDFPARILNVSEYISYAPLNPFWFEDPSLDYFLASMLYSSVDPFTNPSGSTVFPATTYWGLNTAGIYFQPNNGNSSPLGYVRPLLPSMDLRLAYGRIEALDESRTNALIDRTIIAEQDGLTGNIFANLNYSGQADHNDEAVSYNYGGTIPYLLMSFFDSFTGTSGVSCWDYVLSTGTWPSSCRVGFSEDHVPGESASEVNPYVVNASLFLGNDAEFNGQTPTNGQMAFDGFSNLLKWRKAEGSCTELCKNLPAQEQQPCRDASTDVFKEINTSCVGVANGFMGHQRRSWTVPYYGFYPPYWRPGSGGNGAVERVPPVFKTAGGFQNEVFTDSNYIRFGSESQNPSPTCETISGGSYACPEYAPIDMVQSGYALSVPSLQTGEQLQLMFRYRNVQSFSGAFFRVSGTVYFIRSGSNSTLPFSSDIYLSTVHSTWTEAPVVFGLIEGDQVTRVDISFFSSENYLPRVAVDLDAIEVQKISGTTVTSYPVLNGSFQNLEMTNWVVDGDYAANAIDRLGAVAWWGSSSHFATSGNAFAVDRKFFSALMSGRTLGESTLYEGAYAQSGTVYGDPIYRPLAVRIFLDGLKDNPASGDPILGSSGAPMIISAMNGHGKLNITSWEASVCPNHDQSVCDSQSQWTVLHSGSTGVVHHMLRILKPSDLSAYGSGTQFMLRLKVMQPGMKNLYSYFRLKR